MGQVRYHQFCGEGQGEMRGWGKGQPTCLQKDLKTAPRRSRHRIGNVYGVRVHTSSVRLSQTPHQTSDFSYVWSSEERDGCLREAGQPSWPFLQLAFVTPHRFRNFPHEATTRLSPFLISLILSCYEGFFHVVEIDTNSYDSETPSPRNGKHQNWMVEKKDRQAHRRGNF